MDPAVHDPFPGADFVGNDHKNIAALKLLDSMFVYTRLSVNVCSCRHILLLLYFPLGVVLLVLRIVVGFPLACLLSLLPLPRSVHTVLLRYELLILFGIYVRVKGSPSSEARIFVPNHISEFDAVAIRCVLDPVIFAYSMYEDMWWLKCTPVHIFRMVFVPPVSRTEGNVAGRDLVAKKIDDIIQNSDQSILVFPEGGLTNTPTGLLQFHKHTFGLGVKMQPIALTTWSPLPIYIDSAYASFLNNFLCVVFTPFQSFTVQFLPVMESTDSESGLSFSRRVMHEVSKHLGVLSTPFLYSDKKKWLALKKKMAADGYLFEFAIDETKQTVEVFNTRDATSKSKIVPADSNSNREILIGYMRVQWKMDEEDFQHIIFSSDRRHIGPPVCADHDSA